MMSARCIESLFVHNLFTRSAPTAAQIQAEKRWTTSWSSEIGHKFNRFNSNNILEYLRTHATDMNLPFPSVKSFEEGLNSIRFEF